VVVSEDWILPSLPSLHVDFSVCDSAKERRHTGILAPSVLLENTRLGNSKQKTSLYLDVAKYRVAMWRESRICSIVMSDVTSTLTPCPVFRCVTRLHKRLARSFAD
jgi:hypothetical protein